MLALGIDFGTSGARAILLRCDQTSTEVLAPGPYAHKTTAKIIAQSSYQWAAGEVNCPAVWRQTLDKLLVAIAPSLRAQINRIAINGTSATVLLCDHAAQPLTPALLYNDARARSAVAEIQAIAPPASPTLSATSSLAKALWWHHTLDMPTRNQVAYLAHQADWLAALLHGHPPVSDYHNALKLGYDVRSLTYPDWLLSLPIAPWLPAVQVPGSVIAPVSPAIAARFSLPPTCQICAGTTDSIAAFLASGAHQPGEAVTSLGSTLVLKLLSREPVDHPAFGIYSHRLGNLWLVGGASNTGGAVLQQFFTPDQLKTLSQQIAREIDLSQPSLLNYYPLTSPGERFPINDPDYRPRLTPRPAQASAFLHGLLDSMARIEAEGYQKLNDLGAPALTQVYTAGGGAKNPTWQTLRQRYLGVTVRAAAQTEAAYGTAQLASTGLPTESPAHPQTQDAKAV